MKVSRVAEMRAMDKAAIDQYSLAEELLMENAGHAAYTVLAQEIGIPQKTFLVLCGLGNKLTVCLDVTSLVVCSYGCDDGRIEPARCALIGTGRGDR